MSPLERLLQEAIPTRPEPPAPHPRPADAPAWTRAEQDAHWQALCEAVGTPDAHRPRLRLITDSEAA
ncbi:hypothetical protein ABZX40_13315 [Streptomyces sp. NPDC004610]|uniref:hypothetical protein n=1 Tax=unclassified Streptomyces TaxID=2593676 RepID=UPI0033B76771